MKKPKDKKVQKFRIFYFLTVIVLFNSCSKNETAIEILQKAINTIDTIETIYYKQDMLRSNSRNVNDTIFRYREMYFKRRMSDSIVGVKGHWYMYLADKENVVYEDIYDGERLIRKNNQDSVARIYDLVKFPDFKRTHFWSHNTLYGMQYEFRYLLDNRDSYSVKRRNDTIIDSKVCYQISVKLENKTTMPGFATKLEEQTGNISETLYFIDKQTNYLIRIKRESFSKSTPEQKIFIDQKYYDIEFNLPIDEALFNTSIESISGYENIKMEP